MKPDYWLTQTKDKPLFPELEWSRPENRQHAGKLLIVGGNSHAFSAPAEAFAAAMEAGAGTARVLLPDALQKTVGRILENGEYAPSTPSGSFGQKALNDLLIHSKWADAVLFAGDLGRNSETAILLEKFLTKSSARVVLTKDSVDYITSAPEIALNRPYTLVVLSLSQLQRLAIASKSPKAITFKMDLMQLVDWLHDFTQKNRLYILVKHLDNLLVAADGQVSSTRLTDERPIWRVQAAAKASVWWMQTPGKSFKALTVSVH